MARFPSRRLTVLCLTAAILLANGADARDAVPSLQAAAPTVPAHPVAPAVPAIPIAPPAVPPGTPAEIAGDRADAIAHDIALHPPQRVGSRQGSAQLHTVNLKLGGLLDRSVHGSENTEVGRVIDVLVGGDGHLAALKLDVGGFMGVGNRRIAVAWTLFDLAKPGEPLRVALTESQVKSAPTAEDAGEVTVVTGEGGEPVAGPARVRAAPPAGPAAASVPAPTPPLPAVEAPGTESGVATPAPAAGDPAVPAPPAEQPRHAATPPSRRR